jgi:hypothetical protein
MTTERNFAGIGALVLLLGGAGLLSGADVAPRAGAADRTAGTTNAVYTIKGMCRFGNTESPWSATLKPKTKGLYDATYVCNWGGRALTYVGVIETDGKTKISGTGKASSAGANGVFEFSGAYGTNDIARCNYKEVGGGRSGTVTAELPGDGAAKTPAPARAKPAAGASPKTQRR